MLDDLPASLRYNRSCVEFATVENAQAYRSILRGAGFCTPCFYLLPCASESNTLTMILLIASK